MRQRYTTSGRFILLLLVALLGSSWPAAAGTRRMEAGVPGSIPSHNLQATGKHTVYLPLVTRPLGPPEFVITNPDAGATVSGTQFFAVQSVEPAALTSVVFRAGNLTLATDTTPADGFAAYLQAAQLPVGPLQLSATASGPGGSTTQTVPVMVIPNPPSSGSVGPQGATLATATGSTIVVPPGAMVGSSAVAIRDKSQAQVTADTGISWDALGVTFLGAIELETTAAITKPLDVSSVGFGNRVQPGQAVLTYRIQPDRDGDGVGELVVVNGASLAPNGTIVSSPVPELIVNRLAVERRTTGAGLALQQAGVGGPPGSMLTFVGSGFNPVARDGAVVTFRSSVDGSQRDVPGEVTDDPTNPQLQRFRAILPVLPAGAATATVRNASTGATAGPFDLLIEASPPLQGSPVTIITTYLDQAQAFVIGSSTTQPDTDDLRAQTLAKITAARQAIQQLSTSPDAAAQQALAEIAQQVQNTPPIPSGLQSLVAPTDLTPEQATVLANMSSIFNAVAAGLAVVSGVAAKTGNAPLSAEAAILSGIFWAASAALDLYAKYEQQFRPGCPALLGGGGFGNTTGMGSATPSGGNGCGSVHNGSASGGLLNLRPNALPDQRYVIKILAGSGSGRTLTPFTGATDQSGYFFIPLLPQGEPFTAIATDTATGAIERFDGVGPPIGQAVQMFFDFSANTTNNRFPINIGDTVSDGVPTAGAGNLAEIGEVDAYTFSATPGQVVFFDELKAACSADLIWKLVDQDGKQIFNQRLATNDTGCFGDDDLGKLTLTRGGSYTLSVLSQSSGTGPYEFKLWDVPPPQPFNISVDTVVGPDSPNPGAGVLESPGSEDVYTFSAAPDQVVYFDEISGACPANLAWRLVDQDGAVLFDERLSSNRIGCSPTEDAGSFRLTRGGIYTLTVYGEGDGNGPYEFKLWNVPPPQRFAITIGATVQPGVPGPGAGEIETPGTQDIYTFTATPSQRVFFDELAGACAANLGWRLIDEDGGQIFNDRLSTGCGDDAGTFTLARGGTYTLTVGGLEAEDGTGTYQFRLTAQ